MSLSLTLLRKKNTKANLGFSLVELLVVITVLAIILAFAIPNMRQMMLNNRIKTASKTLVTALNMARNEAITRKKEISFCSKAKTGNVCNGSDFKHGALLLDEDGNGNGNVIQRIESIPEGVNVSLDDKIKFKKSGTVAGGIHQIEVTGQGDIKLTICIGTFGQISTKEGTGVTCYQQ